MDAKRVRVLLAAIDAGSMMRAAEQLGYTPSGLAHMMDSLEEELGLTIVQRGRYGVRLTPEGENLLPLLRQYEEADRNIHNRVRLLLQERRPRIRLGAYNSIAQHWLPDIVKKFRKIHPNVEIEIQAQNRQELSQLMRDGSLDLVFCSPLDDGHYRFFALAQDPFMAVLPEDCPFEGDVFPLAEFEKYPFIMPSNGKDAEVQSALSAYHVHPQMVAAVADDPVVVSMVAAGLGVSMLSRLVMLGRGEKVRLVPIQEPIYRALGAVYPEGQASQEINLFLDFVKDFPML